MHDIDIVIPIHAGISYDYFATLALAFNKINIFFYKCG